MARWANNCPACDKKSCLDLVACKQLEDFWDADTWLVTPVRHRYQTIHIALIHANPYRFRVDVETGK